MVDNDYMGDFIKKTTKLVTGIPKKLTYKFIIYGCRFNQTQQPPPATAPASTGRAFGGDSRPFPIQLLNPIYRPAATLRPSAIYPNHRLTESSKSRIVYPTTNRRISMVQQPTKLQGTLYISNFRFINHPPIKI